MKFILTEDSLHSSHMRQKLGSEAHAGIKVGSFNVLLEAMADLWLVPIPDDNWQHVLHQQALEMPTAFWANSLQADGVTTLHELSQGLLYLLDHCKLDQEPKPLSGPKSLERQGRYFNDLVILYGKMDSLRPPQQALAQTLLSNLNEMAIEPLHILLQLDIETIPVWQRQLIEALQHRYDIPQDLAQNLAQLEGSLVEVMDMELPIPSTMSHLFSDKENMGKPDGIEFLSCRDVAEECDLVASMIQVSIDAGMLPNDIAIVCARQGDYEAWLKSSLGKAGVACSGYTAVAHIVDWQVELIHDLLALCAKDAPPMSLQSVLVNPLMPWGRITGMRYAASYVADTKWVKKVEGEHQSLIALLLAPAPVTTETTTPTAMLVLAWITEIAVHIKAEYWGLTAQSFQQRIKDLEEVFGLSSKLNLDQQVTNARAQFQRKTRPIESAPIRTLNSVTLVLEGDFSPMLPRQFKALYVIGFNQNNYEFKPRSSGPLMRTYLDSQTVLGGVEFGTVDMERAVWQTQLKQLLSSARKQLVFTLSRCNLLGETIEPSATLMDMAACFQQRKSLAPHQLIAPWYSSSVNVANDHSVDNKHSHASTKTPVVLRDLQFGENIQSLITQLNGEQRAESPSSLDNLMLSPLTWLLDRLNIKSSAWKVLNLDPLIQGNTAHRVFELYDNHKEESWTQDLCNKLIEQGITDEAEFLQQPQWHLEKQVLTQEISKALNSFVQWSQTNGWQLKKVEQELNGRIWDWPIKGFADAILEHPNHDGVMILDYKKSKHEGRLKRLNAGYELQTAIYRSLLHQQGMLVANTGYYTMNDQTLILDEVQPNMKSTGIKLLTSEELSKEEQSIQATHLIAKRFEQIRRGEIQLNQGNDSKDWKKIGITIYSLEDNALVKQFVKPVLELQP